MRHPFRHLRPTTSPLALVAVAALALASALPASAAERRVEKSFPAASLQAVELENLAGRIDLVPAQGAELRIEAVVHAEASAGESAEALLRALEVETDPHGDRLLVHARYPVDRHRRFQYPGGQRDSDDHWLLSWLGVGSSNVKYQGREVRVTSAESSDAAALWADFRVEVPAGLSVKVKNSVGRITSGGVRADQNLDTASGDIEVNASAGKLILDTGSGDISASDHDGDLSADTGSGDVTLAGIRAETILVDTGSGDVSLVDCDGSLDLDTGSGNIRGRGLAVGARLSADTGSGDVRLAGDFGDVRNLAIDTGSGDVVLDVATAPSVHLRVSTGSGDVEVDLPGMHVLRWKGDFVADVGSAEGKAVVDTGSGDVRIVSSGG